MICDIDTVEVETNSFGNFVAHLLYMEVSKLVFYVATCNVDWNNLYTYHYKQSVYIATKQKIAEFQSTHSVMEAAMFVYWPFRTSTFALIDLAK